MRLAVWVLTILAFVAFALLTLRFVTLDRKARRNAENLLREVRRSSAIGDLDPLFVNVQQHYGPSLKRAQVCTSSDCYYELRISNQLFPWLYRVPYTELSLTFQIHNGSTGFITVDYTTRQPSGASPVIEVQIDSCTQECTPTFYLNPHGRSTELWNGSVELNAKASSSQREAALSLNVNCFIEFGGCRNIVSLLPRVWKLLKANTIASRLPSMADASWDTPEE